MSPSDRRVPKRAKDPIRFVAIVGLIGALLLSVGYVATDRLAHQVEAKTSRMSIIAPQTKVLSVRRAPETLSTVTRLGLLRRALTPVAQQIPGESCFTVNWLGSEIASLRKKDSFIPASAQKIVTGAVALEVLGGDYRFTTAVFASNFVSGTAENLYFVGGGDPLLVRREYVATEKYPTIDGTSLETLTDTLVQAGLTGVSGSVVGVDARYDQVRFLDAWPTSFNVVEAGPLGALVVNDGAVVGQSMKPDNPAVAAATELRTLLGSRGVFVAQDSLYDVKVPANAVQITSIQSAPLSSIVKEMLVNSDNNTAELLVKEIGFVKKKSGTTASGLAVIKKHSMSGRFRPLQQSQTAQDSHQIIA